MHYHYIMLSSYLDQLDALAASAGVNLIDAFARAKVAKTTLYRAREGHYFLSHTVAGRVADAIASTPVRQSRRRSRVEPAGPAEA